MAAPIKAAPSVLAAEIRPFLEIGVANGRRGYVETRAGCSARITHAPNQSNLRAGDLPGLPKCAYGRSQHGTRARKRQRRINAVCQDQCKGGPAMPRDGANVQSLAVIGGLGKRLNEMTCTTLMLTNAQGVEHCRGTMVDFLAPLQPSQGEHNA